MIAGGDKPRPYGTEGTDVGPRSSSMPPVLIEKVGWRYAFAFLAPGPVFGVLSMLRLRALPEAVKIAQGRR